MADVIVEKESKSSAGPIIAVVAIVILDLAALWLLPGILNGNGTNTSTPAPSTSTPAPTQ